MSTSMPTGVYDVNQSPTLYAGQITLQVIATIVVALRFLSRRIAKGNFWWDEWFIVAALVFSWGIAACSWLMVIHGGFGRHTEAFGGPVTGSQEETWLKLLLVLQVFYFLSATSFKTSLILLYYRLFGVSERFRRALIFAEAIVLLYFGIDVLVAIFGCKPVAAYWDKTIQGAQCVDSIAFYRWNGVANLLIDFMILTLTMPMIWGLNMSLRKKAYVTGLFLLGAFVVVASIVRVTTFGTIAATDITSDILPILWSTVEQTVGIICACLIVMRPLINYILGIDKSRKYSSSDYNSVDKSAFPLSKMGSAQRPKPSACDNENGDLDEGKVGFVRLKENAATPSAGPSVTNRGGVGHETDGLPKAIVENEPMGQHHGTS